jgi:hypothetical protein
VFESKVLRRIFGPMMEDVAGSWRRLHNEELHDLHTSLNIIRVMKPRRMKWEDHVTLIGEIRNAYIILVGKPVEKRPLRKPWHWLEGSELILGKVGTRLWTGLMAPDREWWWAVVNIKSHKSWGILN